MGGRRRVSFRVLQQLVTPFLPFIPEVQEPEMRVPLREKLINTAMVVLIYLLCSRLPLYGIQSVMAADPLYWLRAILASTRGTVMELGIAPIASSRLAMKFFLCANIIKIDSRVHEEQILLYNAKKLLGFLFSVGLAVAHVLSGAYGSPAQLGVLNTVLVVCQLCLATVIMLLLDEFLQKGYGLGSATSLFSATSKCKEIICEIFSSPVEGTIVASFHLSDLLATLFIFAIVVYLQEFYVAFPLKSKKCAYGQEGELYRVKLFYASSMPVVLQSAFVSTVYFIFQKIQRWCNGNLIVDMLGTWEESDGELVAVGGFAHYFTAPTSLADMAENPLRALLYIGFMLSFCAVFSQTWIEVSGSSAKDVAKKLIKDRHTMISRREKMLLHKELNGYIPIVAATGGMCIGGLAFLADLMGTSASGTGILSIVTTISQCIEAFEKERASL